MKRFENISIESFQYDLPAGRIANFPVEQRDQSKLLIRTKDGILSKDIFSHLPSHLNENSHVFFNNSRVIPARLVFQKETGSTIEIFCLQPVEPAEYALSLTSYTSVLWKCMIGNLKKFNSRSIEMQIPFLGDSLILRAEKEQIDGNTGLIRFSWNNSNISFAEILSLAGQTPLPPYIKRAPVNIDSERYQTVYAQNKGSVAAPTAGLHFTDQVLKNLDARNIHLHYLTLHVGAGTFQPVKSKYISGHTMHAEIFELNTDIIELLISLPGKVTCVGTTTVRTLESIYWIGVKLLASPDNNTDHLSLLQWEPYSLPDHFSLRQSFESVYDWLKRKKLRSAIASTSLIIVPGYQFKTVDTLITNFHQPRSTLLMLIAAFIGESWKEAYHYAMENDFRFLSYGDSSLLFT